jgi:MarR family transcriptional regulator, organic hydroperoxide resistance regulator
MNLMEGQDPGREAWSIFFELAMENRARLMEALEQLDLTFMQAHVLRLLDPTKPRPMGELADQLKCDASNITGIVDRLEARGLVTRGSAPGDRRVKALAPTPAGLAMRERVLASMQTPPAAIEALPTADKRALRDILRRAVAH